MAAKMIIAVLLSCVCAAYAGNLVAPAVASYAAAPAYATYAHAPIATYAHAPIATYAAAPVAVAAPVLVDNTHFSYGYATPYANGQVDVARNGPIASHAYNFRAGTLF